MEPMEPGRAYNKSVTSRAHSGLAPSAEAVVRAAYPSHTQVSTPGNLGYLGEDESKNTLTGPGDGEAVNPASDSGQKKGWYSEQGDSIELDGSSGRLVLQHHSGTAIVIEPDGTPFITSESARGVGISAPFGDAFVSSGGRFVINGSDISLVARGNLNLDVGGILSINAKGIIYNTKAMDGTIDGSVSTHITDDSATVIGGIRRDTVAGDQRVQIAGENILDVGKDDTTRVKGKFGTYSEGAMTLATKAAQTFYAAGATVIDSDSKIDTVTPVLTQTGTLRVSGEIWSGSNIEANASVKAGVPMVAPEYTLGSVTNSIPTNQGWNDEFQKSQTVDANTVIDEMTSERKYPKYPNNGKQESASQGSVTTISYDTSSQAEEVFQEYSSKNKGNLNPAQSSGSIATINPTGTVGTGADFNTQLGTGGVEGTDSGTTYPGSIGGATAVDSPFPLPTSKWEKSIKISRYFTLGDIIDAKSSHEIPPGKFMEVVKQHARVAYNVLDPIKMKFPDIIVTSGWRESSNSRNHVTGRAIDLVVESRDLARHADIANFAASSLPCDQVFLERNDSGRTHVHVRVIESNGTSVSPTVLTCGDKHCNIRTAGINVEYLQRRGVA